MQSQQSDSKTSDHPVVPAGITVPVNYGAYTNGSFPPTNFTLPGFDPTHYATFYTFGRLFASWFTSAPSVVNTRSGSQTLTLSVPGGSTTYTGEFSGGGNRSTIYGSARWGSGDGTVVPGAPRDFIPNENLNNPDRGYPYGFWPLYWGSINYGMSRKFGSTPSRPGGEQHLFIAGLDETRQDAYYFIIGDASTVQGLNTILALPYEKGGCAMWSGNPIYLFEPDSLAPNGTRTLRSAAGATPRQNITIVPQNVLQYYRASSVALGANVYVNEFSLDNNTRPEYWGRTPFNASVMLPSGATGAATATPGVNRTVQEQARFLDCLNQTIAAAVPIVDGVLPPAPATPTSTSTWNENAFKIGIEVGVTLVVVGIILIFFWKYTSILVCYWRYKNRRSANSGGAPFRPGGHTGAGIIIDDQSTHIPMSTRRRRQDSEENLPVYVPPLADEGEKPPPYMTDSDDRRTQGEVQSRD